MNNNKKYKKWSLWLVAPALVLAPIAVVASCSSSGEEKAVYSVSFKEANLSVKATTNIKPSNLSKEGFVQEIINNKANIFNIEDSSGQVTDDFLRTNLVVNGEITADDNAKTASAEVTLNNKNTDGGSENATITLTDLEELNLTTLKYKIDFVDKGADTQEINLEGKSEVSVTSVDESGLIRLVLEETTKAQILTIDGNDAKKITNDVLENQILTATELIPAATEGKITFKLSVQKPENGAGTTLEKTITFGGFKVETDVTPPVVEKFKIKFKDGSEFTLTGVDQRPVTDFSTAEAIQPVIISNKEVVFETEEGELPADEGWWTENLRIRFKSANEQDGSITVDISLDNFDTTETADQNNNTLTKTDVVLKGFKAAQPSPFLK